MANKKASEKSIRQTAKRTAQNRTVRSRIKTLARANAKAETADAVKTTGAAFVSAVDKAVKKGIVHPNKAARVKSKLAKKVNATSAK